MLEKNKFDDNSAKYEIWKYKTGLLTLATTIVTYIMIIPIKSIAIFHHMIDITHKILVC